MVTIRLAFRNIIGAGVRTWLNVFVLSLAFITIIFTHGLMDGMGKQIMNDMIDGELGGGQFWHQVYDPYDPLTIKDAHGPLSPVLTDLISKGQATPILVTSGAIFPEGRSQTALIKGIVPEQDIVNIPAGALKSESPDVIPALIGTRMAKQTKLNIGDYVTVRWRDIHGTFDAADIQIVQIMRTNVPSLDSGQIWIPLNKLREMLRAPGEATLVVLKKKMKPVSSDDPAWISRDLDFLLKDIVELVKMKKAGSSILYVMLLGMALLAIFDTQVLSIFRRRKEMGMLMALGMPRSNIISLFTVEGAMHGVLALLVGAVYGIPLMYYMTVKGLPVPEMADSMGIAMSSALYPSYGLKLIVGTTLLVLVTVTVVSFLPTRRIAKLKPTDALRGKLS